MKPKITATDWYNSSCCWLAMGKIEEAKDAYSNALNASNGFPSFVSDKGTFDGSLLLKMVVLRRVLDKCK